MGREAKNKRRRAGPPRRTPGGFKARREACGVGARLGGVGWVGGGSKKRRTEAHDLFLRPSQQSSRPSRQGPRQPKPEPLDHCTPNLLDAVVHLGAPTHATAPERPPTHTPTTFPPMLTAPIPRPSPSPQHAPVRPRTPLDERPQDEYVPTPTWTLKSLSFRPPPPPQRAARPDPATK